LRMHDSPLPADSHSPIRRAYEDWEIIDPPKGGLPGRSGVPFQACLSLVLSRDGRRPRAADDR